MPLSISVTLLRRLYEASRHDDNHHLAAEWPPHPARLFNALVSVAIPGTADDDALTWLEHQAPPLVCVPDSLEPDAREGWHVVNSFEPGGYQDLPGHAAKRWRRWPRRVLADQSVVFTWSAVPTQPIVERLSLLCTRVPYFGRAASSAVLSVSLDAADQPDNLVVWEPSTPGAEVLTVPYEGYLSLLRDAHSHGQQPWEAPRRYVGYAPVGVVTDTQAVRGNFGELLVLPFRRGVRVSAQHTLAVAARFRQAVMSVAQPLPDVLHGHSDERGRNQVAFLPLPDVGHANASGMLLGVGIGVPTSVSGADRRVLTLAVARVEQLRLGPLGTVPIDRGRRDLPWALDVRRWTGPAIVWHSASGYVAERFPKRPGDWESDIAAACERAGLPLPVRMRVSEQPLLEGVPNLSTHQRRRRPSDPLRPLRHLELTFPQPVTGPLALGNLRHVGLGLLSPEHLAGESRT